VSGCSGGAISLRTTNQVVVSISDTDFISNYAGYLGASIYIANSLKSSATVTLRVTLTTITTDRGISLPKSGAKVDVMKKLRLQA
jgi:hypothetical protein